MANDLDPASYPLQKPMDEYRIVVLGDSFTNGLQNYLRWPDLLQDFLNRSPVWRERVGGKFTRVLNFGMDGTGIVQWSKVYQYWASSFSPDMVLVSFIVPDIFRKFFYRGVARPTDDAAIREFVENHLLNELPWYGLHSELIAAGAGLFINTEQRLTAAAAYEKYTTVIGDRDASIKQSVSALEQIRCLNPNMTVLQHPTIEEISVREDTERRYGEGNKVVGLETDFLAAAKQHDINIIQMAERNPLPTDPPRRSALYNLPIDTHNSDYGVALSAQWVAKYLIERGTSHPDEVIASRSCAGLE